MKNTLMTMFAAVAMIAATTTATATPADFVGPRVEATAGVSDVQHVRFGGTKATYGVEAGLDTGLFNTPIRVGVEAGVNNVFDRKDITVGGRVGYVVTPQVMVYGDAGYRFTSYQLKNFQRLEGVKYGLGAELAFTKNFYAKAEVNRTNFADSPSNATSAKVGVGLRF